MGPVTTSRASVDWIWERLVEGGAVVFDDFGFRNTAGITRYVEEQVPRPDRIVFHNLNGHAVIVKLGRGG